MRNLYELLNPGVYDSLKKAINKILLEEHTSYKGRETLFFEDVVRGTVKRTGFTDLFWALTKYELWGSLLIKIYRDIDPIDEPEITASKIMEYNFGEKTVSDIDIKNAYEEIPNIQQELFKEVIRRPKITETLLNCILACERCCADKRCRVKNNFPNDTINCLQECIKKRCKNRE